MMLPPEIFFKLVFFVISVVLLFYGGVYAILYELKAPFFYVKSILYISITLSVVGAILMATAVILL